MSKTLHACTKYEVKYGEGHFNWIVTEINCLIKKYFPNAWFNEEFFENSEDIEIDKESFKIGLERMKQNKNDIHLDIFYDAEDIIEIFQSYLDSSDPDNDFVRLCWF